MSKHSIGKTSVYNEELHHHTHILLLESVDGLGSSGECSGEVGGVGGQA